MKQKFIVFVRAVCIKVMALVCMLMFSMESFAQNPQAGAKAIQSVTDSIVSYIPNIQSLLYAIAAVVGMGGVMTIFVKMNNEEQDVKKTIMMVVGSCVALIALAKAIPMFFGVVA